MPTFGIPIIPQLNPTILSPKARVGAQFCDGKQLIENDDLYQNGHVALKQYKDDWDAGSLVINNVPIVNFYNMLGSNQHWNNHYHYLIAYHFYHNSSRRNTDTRNYYFKRVGQAIPTDSQPIITNPPNGTDYPGWIRDTIPVHPNSVNPHTGATKTPACVTVLPSRLDYTDVDFFTSYATTRTDPRRLPVNPNGSVNGLPAYFNIWFKKGFAIIYDLAHLCPSDYPDLSIYDGSSPSNPLWDWRQWLTSDSEYPDEHGVMQTTTPYQPYSYHDFVYRLKCHAENPIATFNAGPNSSNIGNHNYPYTLTYYASGDPRTGGPYYKFIPRRYRAGFFGIDIDMSPQEIFNHFHSIMNSSYNNPKTINPIGAQGINYAGPPVNVSYPGPNPCGGLSICPGVPWVAQGRFNIGNGYMDNCYNHTLNTNWIAGNVCSAYGIYTHPNSSQGSMCGGLPSQYPYHVPNTYTNGLGGGLSSMELQIGKLMMHNHGVENCTGCDAGCFWDWKVDRIRCKDDNTYAFPFESKEDCENYLANYPSPCPKGVIQTANDDDRRNDDDVIVINSPLKPVFNCAGINSCYQAASIPSTSPYPAGSYPSYNSCLGDCQCNSDCCQKVMKNLYAPGLNVYIPNNAGLKTKACISHFHLTFDNPYIPGQSPIGTPPPPGSSWTATPITALPQNYYTFNGLVPGRLGNTHTMSQGPHTLYGVCATAEAELKGWIVQRYTYSSVGRDGPGYYWKTINGGTTQIGTLNAVNNLDPLNNTTISTNDFLIGGLYRMTVFGKNIVQSPNMHNDIDGGPPSWYTGVGGHMPGGSLHSIYGVNVATYGIADQAYMRVELSNSISPNGKLVLQGGQYDNPSHPQHGLHITHLREINLPNPLRRWPSCESGSIPPFTGDPEPDDPTQGA